MKSDSTKKSEIKIADEVTTSDKNNLKKGINQKTLLQNRVTAEKNIKHEWHTLDIEEYPTYLKEILKKSDWINKNTTINILNNDFENKFKLILYKKKIEFVNKGGNEIDFFFNPGYKKDFNDLLREYKNKKNQYFKDLSKKQKTNLARKKEIIEEIKKLIDKNQHDSNTYKNFKNLQDAFYNIGQVPRNENNNIWQTYKFHVERFYDLLHLNKELRDKDYSNNYQEKIKIIEKAEKLADVENIQIAIRELNNLHRLWKNELGPVSRDKREGLWERFQKATKHIHQKKNKYNKDIYSIRKKNYEAKIELINEIKKISNNKENSHNKWQISIKKIEELKNKFISIGRVPKEKNKDIWNAFRDATKIFNQEKNNFYKNLKILEKKSIESKYKLINEVDNILMKEDWRNYAERIKEIQSEWKNTGRVSKKYSEKLWSEFKLKTNNFFEKFKNKNKILNDNEIEIIREQKNFLKKLMSEKIPLTPKKYETFIYDKSLDWDKIRNDDIGNQEKLVLKFLSDKWNEISIPKNKLELKIYQTRLYFIKNNEKQINSEHNSLRKKIEDIKGELNQLENNLDFFSESSTKNPLLVEVNNKIKELTTKKLFVESKLKLLKSMLNQSIKKDLDE
ncbi:MAG: DUF349 domain-containing protein [Flavobacteriales bacterium TMED96]|nr:MAG: DUF349 domain-containing protein [Flavobacteriales bacterium TMED96]|tara:strand:- start:3844 stop:5709 length:1866 start_codon:yes stop_codon:yes gene_type:complete